MGDRLGTLGAVVIFFHELSLENENILILLGLFYTLARKKTAVFPGKMQEKVSVEAPGIDPGTSRMLSERSTI